MWHMHGSCCGPTGAGQGTVQGALVWIERYWGAESLQMVPELLEVASLLWLRYNGVNKVDQYEAATHASQCIYQ